MKNYSIVRIGHEYVVRADKKSILKVASKRKAVQLVAKAAALLDSQSAPQAPLPKVVESSIDRDPGIRPDPSEVS